MGLVLEFRPMANDPRPIYEARISRLRAEVDGARPLDLGLGSAKLLIALAGLVLLYRVAVTGLFFGLPSYVLYACLLVNAIVLLAAEKSRARIYPTGAP